MSVTPKAQKTGSKEPAPKGAPRNKPEGRAPGAPAGMPVFLGGPASAVDAESAAEADADRMASAAMSSGAAAGAAAPAGDGAPLPPPTRAFFEPRLGADFSNVRIHAAIAPMLPRGRSMRRRSLTAPTSRSAAAVTAHISSPMSWRMSSSSGVPDARASSAAPRIRSRLPPPNRARAVSSPTRRTIGCRSMALS